MPRCIRTRRWPAMRFIWRPRAACTSSRQSLELDRQLRIALDYTSFKARALTFLPQARLVHDAIAQRPTIRFFDPLERARDAHELAFYRVVRDAHRRIAVSAHVDEG